MPRPPRPIYNYPETTQSAETLGVRFGDFAIPAVLSAEGASIQDIRGIETASPYRVIAATPGLHRVDLREPFLGRDSFRVVNVDDGVGDATFDRIVNYATPSSPRYGRVPVVLHSTVEDRNNPLLNVGPLHAMLKYYVKTPDAQTAFTAAQSDCLVKVASSMYGRSPMQLPQETIYDKSADGDFVITRMSMSRTLKELRLGTSQTIPLFTEAYAAALIHQRKTLSFKTALRRANRALSRSEGIGYGDFVQASMKLLFLDSGPLDVKDAYPLARYSTLVAQQSKGLRQ